MTSDKGELIRLSKSSISDLEKDAVLGVLDREFLGMGAEVVAFEAALELFFGRPVACVVNGTAALHLALQACGIGPGDEVLVPSLTYIASFQAISATGAKPVACDIDPLGCILDIRDAEKRMTNRTKAIMPVHYTGGVGDLAGIYKFAEENGLRVIEDAAHAFGTLYNDVRVGSFGDVACFSFDGIKNITSGEGGCIVCDDLQVLQKIRDARLLGVQNDTEKRAAGERSWSFGVGAQGWRYHMSNIMAAIGIEQLKRFPDLAARRRELARVYDQKFADHAVIRTLPRDYDHVVPHIYVVRIKNLVSRVDLQEKLLALGIQSGVHYQPNHTNQYYLDESAAPLNVTTRIYPELLTLPLHPDLSDDDVVRVSSELMRLLA